MKEPAELREVATNRASQPETRDTNFYLADRSLRQLLRLYAPAEQLEFLTPRLHHLGALIGDRLDDLAGEADRQPPSLRHRDRLGRDRQSIVKHPAYREMERLAYGEFALAAMSHRPAFGWPEPLHPAFKYAFTYLFAQSEFGLLCPVSMTDSLTRTMPSGEVSLEGATAYLIGESGEGFAQMAEMINQSRLSNAVRSAGLMRRACHEAFAVARGRVAFGQPLADLPLMGRQLLKLLLPTEAALSMAFYTADALHRADGGDQAAAGTVRILTPLLKFRACRDARKVTGDAMEVRGGCGYIEEWIEPRLVRDSHLGSIWEGTSNIVALDVLRAARKNRCHETLRDVLVQQLDAAANLPESLANELRRRLTRAVALVARAASAADGEELARQAASGLYYATAAAVLAIEGATIGATTGDAGRLLLSRAAVREKLSDRDPLSGAASDPDLLSALVDGTPISMETAQRLCG